MILTHGANSISRYNGPFILLNNCDNLDQNNNLLKSLIGPNYSFSSSIFMLQPSIAYPNSTALKMFAYDSDVSGSYSKQDIQLSENVYTIECCIEDIIGCSDAPAYSEVTFSIINFEVDYSSGKYRVEISNNTGSNYTLYNGAGYVTFVSSVNKIYFHLPALIQPCHFAAIMDLSNKQVYVFANGTLYIKCYIYFESDAIRPGFRRESRAVYCANNFFSIRKGDFSNNLQSFTVPTEKYHL